jgi:hypothetical protein
MPERKRKLTGAETKARRKRRERFTTIFVSGKQKRVPRSPTVEGMPVDQFIAKNADSIWLHQNEMWELIRHDD